ncbi:MAG TPA: tRNA (adenosine(37)-N6)-dimethylallyltransferase MiaA [Verrucomicrobiae bacterium]|nr:tRNA (adenosine(37)-N6)-dimethylallyltransferase MiaA [Verrucomicrobiae bacterium]
MKTKIVVIQGPTASGKTELAIRLAERFRGEVVNADSMQVYRGLDIGTAKPTAEQRGRVPHHLLDIFDPDVLTSAAMFVEAADAAIADIAGRGRVPFVTGGTGLYIRALLGGLVEAPSGAGELRGELEELAERLGSEGLHAELARVDPEAAERLHPNDRFRVIRALESHRLTGRPLSEMRREHAFSEERYTALKIGLRVERGELYRRIDQRVLRMMRDGLEEEVRGLLLGGWGPELKSMRSIGYREMCSFLAGEISREEAVEAIARETRRYAKRQMTWFNKDSAIDWFEYPAEFATISNRVMNFLG